ncbi:MAG TPA: hypothetical protein VGM90_25455 [Kofleriaceae bacterium]|jgi:predicted transcriptional regulator
MSKPTESVTLEDDVQEELRKLATRCGLSMEVLVNSALRDYIRYENAVISSVERGLSDLDAGRVSSSGDVLEIVRRAREALASDGGLSREESIARARSVVECVRSRKD